MRNMVKSLQARLPGPLRRLLRRRYYLRVVRSFSESDWEWAEFVKPLIPRGGTVVDVGANVGYLSGLFARWVGPSGRVVSVEPIPDTYDALSSSMKRLYPEVVTPLQCCVSDRNGHVTMTVPEYSEGGMNYYESRIVDPDTTAGPHRFTVPATTLDQLLHEAGKQAPSFIKIDVEGHELAVVTGGREFLTKTHTPLLIEVAGNPDDQSGKACMLFSTLRSWGYVPHVIRGGKLSERRSGESSVDYLFLNRQ